MRIGRIFMMLLVGVGACDDLPPQTNRVTPDPEVMQTSVLTAAIVESVRQVQGPWASGRGSLVLDLERVRRLYPEEGPGLSRDNLYTAFLEAGQRLGLTAREGTNTAEVRCEDRSGRRAAYCVMDQDVLLIQPDVFTERGPDEYRIAISTKKANEVEGYVDWVNHTMTFRHIGGSWELSDYGRGVIN